MRWFARLLLTAMVFTTAPSGVIAADAQDSLAAKAEAAAAAAKRAVEAADAAAKASEKAKDAAAAAVAAAQEATDAAKAAKQSVQTELQVVATAPASSPKTGADLSTYLTANGEGGNATIKLTDRIVNPGGDFIYSVALSSPLAKETKLTQLATLDGLSNGANVTVSFGKFVLTDRSEDTGVWSVGGLARLGYAKLKYVDSMSLGQESTSRYNRAFAPYIGYRPPGPPVFLIAKFEYQKAFKDGDTKVLCAQPTTFPSSCVTGPIGTPVKVTKRLASLSARYTNALFDAAPTLTYDQVTKTKGIDVPIYFIKAGADAKNILPFNAGVRFGWQSDNKDLSIGIFIGSPFSLFTP